MRQAMVVFVLAVVGAGCSSSSTARDAAAVPDGPESDRPGHLQLDSAVRGADAGCSAAQSKACFSLCRGVAATPAEFSCHGTGTAAELSGAATLSASSATGCSGTLVTAGSSLSLWLHCDTCSVCADLETECYLGTFGTGLFSCAVGESALSCTKK